ELIEAFHREMSNDFGTVGALREILIGFRKANELRQGKKSPAKAHTAALYAKVFRELFQVFGLLQAAPESFIQSLKSKIAVDMGLEEAAIERLIQDRKAARDGKDFARGDEIRAELTSMGIVTPAEDDLPDVFLVACGVYQQNGMNGTADGAGEVFIGVVTKTDVGAVKLYQEWRGPAFSVADRSSWPVDEAELQTAIDKFHAEASAQ
ncbi:MAG: hypothetical protein EOP21_12650, partial [Hyphomicrobiales bacterium]